MNGISRRLQQIERTTKTRRGGDYIIPRPELDRILSGFTLANLEDTIDGELMRADHIRAVLAPL